MVLLYAATSNAGKLREFRESARASGMAVEALPGLAGLPEPVEDALTFMGNAELKAVAYSRSAPELLVFADDSGLEVDALGGRPGVRSARFADDLGFEMNSGTGLEVSARSGKDDRNLRALLELMKDVPEARRTARFRCALVLARDGEVLLRAEGEAEGEILNAARGVGGFGYDPVFFMASFGKTLAEMLPAEKWSVSHRGRAFRNLVAEVLASGLARAGTPDAVRD